MRTRRFHLIALFVTSLAWSSPAKAAVINFDLSWLNYNASGQFTVANVLNAVSGYDILSITGTVTGLGGGLITGLVTNPTQPFAFNNGAFLYNNVGFPTDPHLDNNGVLFSTANGSIWNIYSNGPSDYALYKYADANSGGVDSGQLIAAPVISAVPELSTWAMMLIGFAGLGFMAYRRNKLSVARARA